MAEISEQDSMAIIRTLLALERNYLAEERTALSEFRTGLGLTTIAPIANTATIYIFSTIIIDPPPIFQLINFAFLTFLTVIGVLMTYISQSRLKKIRSQKKTLKDREKTLINSSKNVSKLFNDIIDIEDEETNRLIALIKTNL